MIKFFQIIVLISFLFLLSCKTLMSAGLECLDLKSESSPVSSINCHSESESSEKTPKQSPAKCDCENNQFVNLDNYKITIKPELIKYVFIYIDNQMKIQFYFIYQKPKYISTKFQINSISLTKTIQLRI